MVTVPTLALPTVPVPPPTLQVWVGAEGCVLMVTAKVVPLLIAVGKTKLPVGPKTRSSPALFCRTMLPPTRPMTLPPMVYLLVTQVIRMSVIAAFVTVPVPIVTAQVWYGLVGWVWTVMA